MKINANILRILENHNYRVIAIDYPGPSDFYFNEQSNKIIECGSPSDRIRIIVEKIWECPAWLKGKYLVKHGNEWWIYKKYPCATTVDAMVHAMKINRILDYINFEFIPPPSSPWECR